ncbi:MAG: GldG family protein [Clostridia bacterium]|nr:GldG family protein [Clostridia bacterium]
MNKRKYLINSSVIVVGVLAIAVLFNILVSVFVAKFPVKIDLTSSQIYGISDKTYEFLKNFNTPVTIYILAGEAEQDTNVRTILDKYAQANSNIKIQNVDPNENPTFGKKYVKSGDSLYKNSIIIDAGDRFKVYKSSDLYNVDAQTNTATSIKVEQKITAGLKYVASDTDFTVYFIKGHGEMELDGAKAKLEAENFIVKDLNIVTDDIPSDAQMIIVASPTSDYTASDLAKLDKFFSNAGKAQFLFEYSSLRLTNLYSYIKEWGIEVNDNIAVEPNRSNILLLGNSSLILPVFESSDITDALIKDQRIVGYYPYSKTLNLLFESNSGIEVKKLLSTSSDAYVKTDIENLKSVEKSEGDKTGSFAVAAVSTKQGDSPKDDSIIFVSGTTLLLDVDADTLTNYGFANYDLYMNVVNFLQGSKDDYSIQAKSLIGDTITVSTLDAIILGAVFVIVIPLCVLIFGIVVWARRRHL